MRVPVSQGTPCDAIVIAAGLSVMDPFTLPSHLIEVLPRFVAQSGCSCLLNLEILLLLNFLIPSPRAAGMKWSLAHHLCVLFLSICVRLSYILHDVS